MVGLNIYVPGKVCVDTHSWGKSDLAKANRDTWLVSEEENVAFKEK